MPFTGNRQYSQLQLRRRPDYRGRSRRAHVAAIPDRMAMWDKGFYVRYGGDTIQMGLPFTTEPEEIDSLISALAETLGQVD
jgi:adenosylmethionine-8-amino-7-oxononanoate aminotransferase